MSTVLLLADNSFTRRLLLEVLSEDGHTTFVARSTHEVFAILGVHAEIDLLFVDIQDSRSLDFDGLAQEAKRLRPAMSVLHATALTRTAPTSRRISLFCKSPVDPNASGPRCAR